MKFFHLGDLHIGKQLYQYNLKEDQEFILNQILEYANKEKPDAILIAGDVYDRKVPSAEAVTIFDDFLTRLSELRHNPEILIISGNHDGAERLDFANSILEKHRVHIAGKPPESSGEFMKKVILKDSYGNVNFYLFPFIKPSYVKSLLEKGDMEGKENREKENKGKESIEDSFIDITKQQNYDLLKTGQEDIENGRQQFLTYDQAVQKMIEREHINTKERNVIISHQFYIWGNQEIERSESEVITVGNIDSVHAKCLEIFDYAALGHIHKPTIVGKNWIRYCGTPLAYSVSEEGQNKGILMVELKEKGVEASIQMLPLKPLRKVRKEEGLLEEILKKEKSSDFVSILLKDEDELWEARERLMEVFDHILEIRLDNSYIQDIYQDEQIVLKELNMAEVFHQFYQEFFTKEMNHEQERILKEVIEECDEL